MQNRSGIGQFFHNKITIFTLVFDIILVIFVIVLSINKYSKNASISFDVAPLDAKITINGQEGYNSDNSSYYFTPGSYDIQISHPDLDTKTFHIELEPNHSITISAFLSSDGNFTFYEDRNNLDSLNELIKIASSGNNKTLDQDSSAEPFIENYLRNVQLLDILPIIDITPTEYGDSLGINYENDILSIDDGASLDKCNKVLCLHITDTSGNKEQFALSVIERFGFDKELYQIIYEEVEYENEDEYENE